MPVVFLDKKEILLQIRANPADPTVFQFYYCANCQESVVANGLFPRLEEQVNHHGHALAWMPGQDSFLSSPQELILRWLAVYRPFTSSARYQQLGDFAPTTSSANWVWVLRGSEQAHWLSFLDNYLSHMAETWKLALNGQPSEFFDSPAVVWKTGFNSGEFCFEWSSAQAVPLESFLNLLNPR